MKDYRMRLKYMNKNKQK